MAVAVVVWAMLYYPHDPVAIQEALVAHQSALEREAESGRLSNARLSAVEEQLAAYRDVATREKLALGEAQRQSLLGMAGRAIEPAVRPLGWDWRIGSAVIASFPAQKLFWARWALSIILVKSKSTGKPVKLNCKPN